MELQKPKKDQTIIEKANRALKLKGPKQPFLAKITIRKTIDAIDAIEVKDIIAKEIRRNNLIGGLYITQNIKKIEIESAKIIN